MKKLAIVCGSLAHGGAERVTAYLAQRITRMGVECTIITLDKAAVEYALPEGVSRINVQDISSNIFMGLRKAYRISKCEEILIMGVSNCIYAIPPAFGLGKKIVVSERNSPQNFAGKKSVQTFSRFLMRFADGFVFQTEGAKSFYDKRLNGRGTVIPNPLITDHLPAPYYGKRDKRIVAVGRLKEQKNHMLLIHAFNIIHQQFPEYILEIYGEGTLRSRIEDEIAICGMENKVFLKGNVNDVFSQIYTAALFVMPSNFEGMPNALIEAMALGVPCVATDCPCGGPKYLILHGENGLLCNVGDEKNMSEALAYMLSNPDKAEEMGRRAVMVRDKLNADVITHKWYEYLCNTPA